MPAPLSPDDFTAICELVCPHCRRGNIAEKRPDNAEWQHVERGGRRISISVCWATDLRNSPYSPALVAAYPVPHDAA